MPLHRPDANAFGRLQSTEINQARINARAHAEILLITSDGDRVTLTADSGLLAEHTIYDSFGRIQNQTVSAHAEKLQISTSNEFVATIQGELDREELADIKKLLDALETSAPDFFSSGQSDELLASFAAEIGYLGSIVSFEAALSYSREASAQCSRSITSTGQAAPSRAARTAPTDEPVKPRSVESFHEKLAKLAEHLEDEKGVDKLPTIRHVFQETR